MCAAFPTSKYSDSRLIDKVSSYSELQLAVHRVEHADEYRGPQAADRLRRTLAPYKLQELRQRAKTSGVAADSIAEGMATPDDEGGAHSAMVELIVAR